MRFIFGYEEALEYFQRALAAKEGRPMDAETADLLFGTGRALAVTLPRYQVHEAVESLRRAFDHYVETGDLSRAVAVAECPIPAMAGNRTGMVELLKRALPNNHLPVGP